MLVKISYTFSIFIFFGINLFAQQEVDYFPLQIGNKWVYERLDRDGFDVIETIDTLRLDQKLYYNFQIKYAESDRVYNTTYYYKDSDNQIWIMYGQSPQQAEITYNFNIEVGESWVMNQYFYIIATLESKTEIIETHPQTFNNCYYFSFNFVHQNITTGNYFAPNIGLVQRSDEVVRTKLKGAFINGKIIGDTTTTVITSVGTKSKNTNYFFVQNYPNPFNSQTIIKYQLPTDNYTKMIIYNQIGQTVKILENDYKQRGVHEVIWDGTNSLGNQVPSGIYYLKVVTHDFSQMRKLVLIH